MPTSSRALCACCLLAMQLVGGGAAPAVAQVKPLRVLVYHDMEGLAGQDDPFTFIFSL